ncbi:ASNSD1 upstream open reading frame protein-like isoform X2 [Haliotis rubra]|uniref:ASNSD1 upstream open reading frame protein-like isoform X1 n=1 Tax=Haliotis rubra TaxID=36100 RepID=UPI001EE62078|nr:ASNSD1 upstream open reading frame protein-like isoform X1 [Haliotis rubra]XP_046577186.1 ASNSD1 upstream open reading frame protein-like isoform X2 [Haliotis rubra]
MSNTGAVRRKQKLDSKITEQKVLQDEMKSIRKGARVYRQQQNSNILFLSTVDREMAQSKKTMEESGGKSTRRLRNKVVMTKLAKLEEGDQVGGR